MVEDAMKIDIENMTMQQLINMFPKCNQQDKREIADYIFKMGDVKSLVLLALIDPSNIGKYQERILKEGSAADLLCISDVYGVDLYKMQEKIYYLGSLADMINFIACHLDFLGLRLDAFAKRFIISNNAEKIYHFALLVHDHKRDDEIPVRKLWKAIKKAEKDTMKGFYVSEFKRRFTLKQRLFG